MSPGSIIYIIGFMGSGKSTTGKRLAESMGWSFIDLDRKIEEIAGKTIPEIFETEGEAKFRITEAEALKSLYSSKQTVISTGGGAPCYGDNMDFMLASGVTVYLKLTPGQLTERLLSSSTDRPLIKNIPDKELQGFIEEKLSFREAWYARADIIIHGNEHDITYIRQMVEASGRHKHGNNR
jgi:shikimate kinase